MYFYCVYVNNEASLQHLLPSSYAIDMFSLVVLKTFLLIITVKTVYFCRRVTNNNNTLSNMGIMPTTYQMDTYRKGLQIIEPCLLRKTFGQN